ncbi:glycosyltransferase [Flavobacterium sp.]|uniref:glycosyltransferase n=1 Tax=Flavobacterium sp. TaxID=239 RepID=UPI00338D41C8
MEISVVFSTYNSEEWLEKVILGFSVQTFRNFEIIIADDGSREATKNLIDKLRTEIDIPIIHVWQEDNGFQKSQILNKAILKSTSEYLIFTDGDCIPRNDFVQNQLKQKEFGFFYPEGILNYQ